MNSDEYALVSLCGNWEGCVCVCEGEGGRGGKGGL